MPTNAALTLLHPSKSLESIATWISAAAAAVFPDFNSLRIKFASQSCIIAFDSRDDCRATETACRDKKIAGRQVGCSSTTSEEYSGLLQEILPGRNKGKAAPDRDGLQIKLFNLPYSITEEELKKVFPRCRRIFFAKNKSGTSCGLTSASVLILVNSRPSSPLNPLNPSASLVLKELIGIVIAILTFKKRLICEAALKRAKHLTLHGRRIRAEVNVSLAKTEPGESVGLKTRTKKARTTPNQVSHPKRQPTNPHSPPPEDVVKLNVAEGTQQDVIAVEWGRWTVRVQTGRCCVDILVLSGNCTTVTWCLFPSLRVPIVSISRCCTREESRFWLA
ncbi:unnamed protein product [Mesocestoides corti]|uniref:RRM domain-containing protein n=1 Tax=Mesocestoides corti TaxID=53468 RepID=A0A158QUS2_MESCO|nr:unnamed protein product [Mesocestoides corti]